MAQATCLLLTDSTIATFRNGHRNIRGNESLAFCRNAHVLGTAEEGAQDDGARSSPAPDPHLYRS